MKRSICLFFFLLSGFNTYGQVSTGSTGGLIDPKKETLIAPGLEGPITASIENAPQREAIIKSIKEKLLPTFELLRQEENNCSQKLQTRPTTLESKTVLEVYNSMSYFYYTYKGLKTLEAPSPQTPQNCECSHQNKKLASRFYSCLSKKKDLIKSIKDHIILNESLENHLKVAYPDQYQEGMALEMKIFFKTFIHFLELDS